MNNLGWRFWKCYRRKCHLGSINASPVHQRLYFTPWRSTLSLADAHPHGAMPRGCLENRAIHSGASIVAAHLRDYKRWRAAEQQTAGAAVRASVVGALSESLQGGWVPTAGWNKDFDTYWSKVRALATPATEDDWKVGPCIAQTVAPSVSQRWDRQACYFGETMCDARTDRSSEFMVRPREAPPKNFWSLVLGDTGNCKSTKPTTLSHPERASFVVSVLIELLAKAVLEWRSQRTHAVDLDIETSAVRLIFFIGLDDTIRLRTLDGSSVGYDLIGPSSPYAHAWYVPADGRPDRDEPIPYIDSASAGLVQTKCTRIEAPQPVGERLDDYPVLGTICTDTTPTTWDTVDDALLHPRPTSDLQFGVVTVDASGETLKMEGPAISLLGLR